MIISNQLNNSVYFKSRNKKDDIVVYTVMPSCNYECSTRGQVYDRFINAPVSPWICLLDGKDRKPDRLYRMSESYRKKSSLENKEGIINFEREMIYEELDQPILTLTRNYKKLSKCFDEYTTPEEKNKWIMLWNTNAIARLESLHYIFPTKCTKNKINVLKKAYDSTDGETKMDKIIRGNIASTMYLLYKISEDDEDKKSIEDFFEKRFNARYNIGEGVDNTEGIKELEKNIEQPWLFDFILNTSSKENEGEITHLVQEILTNDDCSDEMRELAVWGAGKYRSDENFEIIKNIALNKDEENIRLRHYAIQSSALYLRERPDEVVEIMDTISQDGTIFAPLGKLLKDKVQGKYHTNLYREYDYQSFPEEEHDIVSDYINNGHMTTDSAVNIQKCCKIAGDLSYFRNVIKNEKVGFPKAHILKDTYTAIRPFLTGDRLFSTDDLNSGDFYDSTDGCYANSYIMMNKGRFGTFENGNLAHEFAHSLNGHFDREDLETQKKLFEQAERRRKHLCVYSSTNEQEYFAVGVQAYATTYLPHSTIIRGNSITRYDLLEKDPDLYNFIEKVLNKY